MKLNINPKELLALYNVLYERFESSADGTCYKEGDERESTDTQLHQLYNRVKACIIASLSNKLIDPFESWEAGQKVKIAELERELDNVKADASQLAKKPTEVLSADDIDVQVDYPTKTSKSSPRHGRFQGPKR